MGMLYLNIENLLNTSPQNLGMIPKEPTLNIASYLQSLVDELLKRKDHYYALSFVFFLQYAYCKKNLQDSKFV